MKKKIGFLLIGFSLLPVAYGFAQTESFEQQQFERMAQEYGEVSDVAWLSVMHGMSNGLSAGTAELYDETQFPFELARNFTASQKAQLKKEIIDYLQLQGRGRQELLFHRVQSWLLAWQQWNICTKLKSIEETVAVLYEMKPDQSMFQYVRKNRRFKKGDVTGTEMASSMSSAEVSGLEYEFFNEWSLLPREEIITIFSKLLTKLNQQ
ncbi:MAG TPA: hypothetical protein VKA08_05325 [Balneolales bacterium]|nr:hypothetical protein [Balneolales bacterium]